MIKKLIFLEFVNEAEQYLSGGNAPSEATLFIALTPRVRLFLEERGFKVYSTYEHFDTESHKKVVLKVEEMIQALESVLGIHDKVGISETYQNTVVFYARFLFTYLCWSIEVVHNACKEHAPKAVEAPLTKIPMAQSPVMMNTERYLGTIVEAYAKSHRFPFQGFEVTPEQTGKGGEYINVSIPGARGGILEQLALKLCMWSFKRACQRPAILSASFGYRMDVLVAKLQKEFSEFSWILFLENSGFNLKVLLMSFLNAAFSLAGARSRFAKLRIPVNMIFPTDILVAGGVNTENDGTFKYSLEQSFQKIKAMPEEVFSFEQVSFRDVVLTKLKKGIVPEIERLHSITVGMDSLFSKAKPLFVMSPFSRGVTFALGELCRKHSIAGMLIPHGTFRPPENRFEEIEFDHLGRGVMNSEFPYVSAQSPWEVKYAEHYKLKSQVVNTGPLIWSIIEKEPPAGFKEKLLGKQNAHKKVILHAATHKWRRFLRVYINETADEYIQEIRELFEAIENMDGVVLVVKFRPGDILSLDDLRASLSQSDRLIIVVDESLSDLLGITDLLVSYQSTVIEEALLSRVPVLQYGGRGRYVHFSGCEIQQGMTPIRSAVYHVSDASNLSYGVRWILMGGRCLDDSEIQDHIFRHDEKKDIVSFIKGFQEYWSYD